ncbi:MAG: histidinol-phosphate transaminase [Gammaproteobacteria bacterium]
MTDQDLASAVFRKEVLAMSAYKVMNAAGMIKLDAMENPYSWPDDIKNRWLETLKDCSLNRYPDPEAGRLVKTIRTVYQLQETAGLLLGNGSDEIIQLLLMALPSGARVLSPDPGFVMYGQISRCLGLNYVGVPLRPDNFDLDLPATLSAIDSHRPSIIFLAYPNNPTGNLFSETSIREIIEKAPGLVVIDEAYEPFAGASYLSSLAKYDKLLVMRTVSKLGLAGLRLGYLAGKPAIIEQINKIRLPYNINILTQASAEFALGNTLLFDEQIRKICTERMVMFNRLSRLNNIRVFPSVANFILFKTGENQADGVFGDLQQQGILIKNLSPQGGLLRDCLRVTIGKPEENAAFLTALEKSLASR